MRKALKRAALGLAAASALGLVHPAVARTPPLGAKGPASNAVVGSAVKKDAMPETVTDACQSKLETMQVELALLDNPATFAYALGCKHNGSNMDVYGFVPNNLIKKQALETARKNCSVPLVDRVQLHPSLTARTPADANDDLHHEAVKLLAETLGDGVAGVEIKVGGSGQLQVNGSCTSYEQKLAVSKKLRGLHGCCSVVNSLNVKPVMRNGRLVTLVSADGSYAFAANGASPAMPVRPVRNVADSAPSASPITTVSPAKPATTARYDAPATVKSDLPPAPVKKSDSVTSWTRDTVPPVAMKTDVPPLPPYQLTQAQLGGTATATAPTIVSPAGKPSASNITDPWKPTDAPPAKPVTPLNNGPWPQAHDARSTPVVAYTTTGVVQFDDQPLPEPPPLLVSNDKASGVLKQQIASVCGAKVKEVLVETAADGITHVIVKPTNPADSEALVMKILSLPEMASPNVKLEMRLVK